MRKIILFTIIMCIGALGKGKTKPQESIGPVVSMEYRMNSSWEQYPICHFMLQVENDRYFLRNGTGCERDKAPKMEVPVSFAEQVQQIVMEEDMLSYKRDYQPLVDIHDGDSWTIYIRFADSDKSVYSSGYMAWPKGNGLKRIEQLCKETWDSKGKK